MTEIQARLFALRDEKYRDFCANLTPTLDKDRMIGVRTPAVRALARALSGTEEAARFMEALPHEYYEENNLHAALIERIKDYGGCMEALERFLPFIDNWATCDMLRPGVFKKHRAALLEKIRGWLRSGETYTIRFGLGMLLCHYLDGDFSPEYLALAASPPSEEYYVRMMTAWYFATALAKQYDAALPYIERRRLPLWVHNKAIQKALESSRVSGEHKAYLRTLRQKD